MSNCDDFLDPGFDPYEWVDELEQHEITLVIHAERTILGVHDQIVWTRSIAVSEYDRDALVLEFRVKYQGYKVLSVCEKSEPESALNLTDIYAVTSEFA